MKRRRPVFAACPLPFVAALAPAVAAPQAPPACAVERDRLFAVGGSGINDLGYAIALERDTLFVGAPNAEGPAAPRQGAVYLFRRAESGWEQAERLVGSTSADLDRFGSALAVDGDVLVVGAWSHDLPGAPQAGAAYVFERAGSEWAEVAALTAPGGAASEAFGRAVAVDGGTVVVGALLDGDRGSQAGSVHVFERSGSSWVHRVELYASDAHALGRFGQALDLEDGRLVVAAPDVFGTNTGAVYVLEGAGAAWSEVARLVPGVADYDQFGGALDLDGDRLAVGCRYVTPGAVASAGAVYVFERAGSTWTRTAELTAADPNPFELMGHGVGLRGDVLMTGAITATHAGDGAGAAYLFRLADGAWSERQRLLPTGVAGDENFGRSFAWDAGSLFVSADAAASFQDPLPGSVFVYDWLPEPTTYCTGKTGSTGCVPFVAHAGTPSVSSTAPFRVEGRDVLPGEFGVLLYARQPANLDFHGGHLCVKAPVFRLLPPKLAKAQGDPPCAGVLARDFNATIQSGADPSLTVGRTVSAQWLQRDSADPTGFGDALTDALRFTVCP